LVCRLQEKAGVLKPGVEPWQANSKCAGYMVQNYDIPHHDGIWERMGRGFDVLLHISLTLALLWGWVVDFTTRPLYPRDGIPVTIAGVDILCGRGVLIGCVRSGDLDHKLVLWRPCLGHWTPCGP